MEWARNHRRRHSPVRVVCLRFPLRLTDHLKMTTNANTAPPGWHPDPSNPGGALRWWDGMAWTTHTRQAAPSAHQAAAPAAAWPGGGVTIAPNYGTANYGSASYVGASAGGANFGGTTYAPATRTFAQRNRQSLTAIGFVRSTS